MWSDQVIFPKIRTRLTGKLIFGKENPDLYMVDLSGYLEHEIHWPGSRLHDRRLVGPEYWWEKCAFLVSGHFLKY